MPQTATPAARGSSRGPWNSAPRMRWGSCAWKAARRLACSNMRRCNASAKVRYGPWPALGSHARIQRAKSSAVRMERLR
eukprot:4214792-Lingulodinium_polyedra.AAC.1